MGLSRLSFSFASLKLLKLLSKLPSSNSFLPQDLRHQQSKLRNITAVEKLELERAVDDKEKPKSLEQGSNRLKAVP